MSLVSDLAKAKSEEDVKDSYIKALGLKQYTKGLIDIQTAELWFESKHAPTASVLMFAQLLFYVRDALKKGESIPALLCVIDREKAAIMETAKALPIFDDKSIQWPKSGSKVDKKFSPQVAPYIEAHFVEYRIADDEQVFIDALKQAIQVGRPIRTPITPDNLRQVFDKWVERIGCEIDGVAEADYALLFFADIMHDGAKAAMENLPARLLHHGEQPIFFLNGVNYELATDRGYRQFWAMYHRPPEAEHRAYLLERRDSLLPLDERSFKGAFYTPLHIVDKAYEWLGATLGRNWQKNYLVWDMCCGVGNLEVKHSNHRNLFMSTLDAADIDVMKASRTCVAATRFQYDYLNDDVDALGQIDYSLTNKMPVALREAIADFKAKKKGAKKILVLINPPYGEAANSQGNAGKTDIAKTAIGATMDGFGYAARELFVQFLVRIQRELPGATIAMFSTLKYINAPNFAPFRAQWQAKYLGGFVVHSRAFDGLKGDFPIGFLIWDTSKKEPLDEIKADVLDKEGKFFEGTNKKCFRNIPNEQFLSGWIKRLKKNDTDVIPLINAFTPTTKTEDVRNTKWSNGAIGHFFCNGNDFQNAGTMTALFSSVHSIGHAGGYFVTEDNLWQVAIVFTVRRLIKPTWLNDRDQFLQPSGTLTPAFKSDCLIWMLFNGSNLSAGADGLEWNGKTWSLVNHFIPFTETDVKAKGRFESDFMVQYLKKIKLTKEAKAVMAAGRTLWTRYHETKFEKKIRDEFKLNRPDVGWYQIRRALEANSDNDPVDFEPFKIAYDALSQKLRPQVFELGFLLE